MGMKKVDAVELLKRVLGVDSTMHYVAREKTVCKLKKMYEAAVGTRECLLRALESVGFRNGDAPPERAHNWQLCWLLANTQVSQAEHQVFAKKEKADSTRRPGKTKRAPSPAPSPEAQRPPKRMRLSDASEAATVYREATRGKPSYHAILNSIALWKDSLTGGEEVATETDLSKVHRNMAVAHAKCVAAATGLRGRQVQHFKEMLKCFDHALACEGVSTYWKDGVVAKRAAVVCETVVAMISSDGVVPDEIFVLLRENFGQSLLRAEALYDIAVRTLGVARNYIGPSRVIDGDAAVKIINKLAEIERPLNEACACTGLAQDKDLRGLLEALCASKESLLNRAKCARAQHYGDKRLEAALNDSDELNMGFVYDAWDAFKHASVLAWRGGVQVIEEAIPLEYSFAVLFGKVLSRPLEARDHLRSLFTLASQAAVHVHAEVWYCKARAWLEAIREEEQKRRDEDKNKVRSGVLKKPLAALGKAREGITKETYKIFITYVYTNHPPPERVAKDTTLEALLELPMKKCILQSISHHHTDKYAEAPLQERVLREEITAYLNTLYELISGKGC